MKTDKPYAQVAYCPEPGCWFRFTIISVYGFDESKQIKCPVCGEKNCRIEYGGDYGGDQLRDLYKAVDKAHDEEKKKKEATEDDDETKP